MTAPNDRPAASISVFKEILAFISVLQCVS
jgi:hypothetical protein